MKNLTLIFSILISLSSESFAGDSDCITRYRKQYFSKRTKYHSKVDRWQSRQISLSSIGATLTNDPPPKIENYNLYEEEIIKSYEMNLTHSTSHQPNFFKRLYKKAKSISVDVTPQFVQDQLKELIDNGTLCKGDFFGLVKRAAKPRKAKRLVLESIKSKTSIAKVFDDNDRNNPLLKTSSSILNSSKGSQSRLPTSNSEGDQ